MRPKRTFQFLGLVVAILLMSVGYAAIQNIELSVSGNAVATPDQGNFKVAFTGEPTHEGTGQVALKITGDTSATMQVSGLKAVGDTMTAKFTIANTSADITAYLSSSVTHTNTTYFEVTSKLSSTEVAPLTGTAVLSVTVKLIKSPVTESQTDTLTVEVIASPTKPISFTIDGTEYTAYEGQTWAQWAYSSANTKYSWTFCGGLMDEILIDDDKPYTEGEDMEFTCWVVCEPEETSYGTRYYEVLGTYKIVDGGAYVTVENEYYS